MLVRRRWRGAGGGRRRGEGGRCDARARGAHAGRAGASVGRARATRATGGRAHRILLGDRRAALGRKRGTRLQSHHQRRVANLPGRRLSALSTQYHVTAVVHRTSRR